MLYIWLVGYIERSKLYPHLLRLLYFGINYVISYIDYADIIRLYEGINELVNPDATMTASYSPIQPGNADNDAYYQGKYHCNCSPDKGDLERTLIHLH